MNGLMTNIKQEFNSARRKGVNFEKTSSSLIYEGSTLLSHTREFARYKSISQRFNSNDYYNTNIKLYSRGRGTSDFFPFLVINIDIIEGGDYPFVIKLNIKFKSYGHFSSLHIITIDHDLVDDLIRSIKSNQAFDSNGKCQAFNKANQDIIKILKREGYSNKDMDNIIWTKE